MKKKLVSFVLTCILVITPFMGNMQIEAATTVAINSTNFPDAIFREYISEEFDLNGNGSLSSGEIENATIISFYRTEYPKSLEGIKYLTYLEELSINGGWLEGYCDVEESDALKLIDVSGMKYLKSIYCRGVGLEELIVTNCINLYWIDIRGNWVKSLELTTLKKLYWLDCGYNSMTSLKLDNTDSESTELRMEEQKLTVEALPVSNFSIDLNQYSGFEYSKATISSKYLDGATYSKGIITWANPADVPDQIKYTYKVQYYYFEYGYDTMDVTVNIEKKNLNISDCDVSLANSSYIYNGSAYKPKVSVSYKGYTLNENESFTTSYSNNTNAGTAKVVIAGINGISGTVTKTFTINPKQIQSNNFSLSNTSYVYTGSNIIPTLNSSLIQSTDYTVSCSNNKNVGTASVLITGKGNYTGTVTKSFAITQADVAQCTVTVSGGGTTYTGNQICPSVAVKNPYGATLVPGTDYTVYYGENINVGSGNITITGKGNYKGTNIQYFTISKANISNCNISLSSDTYTYDGTEKEPDVTVNFKGTSLTKDVDYTVSYQNNVKQGTANIIIKGTGDKFTGTTYKDFYIKKDISEEIVSIEQDRYEFTGNDIIPDVFLVDNGDTLIKNVDYTLEYSDNKNIGTAQIIINGKGKWQGTVIKQFEIVPIEIEKCNVEFTSGKDTFEGTGEEICPEIRVTLNGVILKEGTDYIVTYLDNIKIGEATILIEGNGNVYGSASKSFTIKEKVTVPECTTAVPPTTAPPTTRPNTSSMVLPGKASIKYVKNVKTRKIKISIKRLKGASGYQIKYSLNRNFKRKKLLFTKKLNVTLKNLKKGKKYFISVRAYRIVDNKKIYGKWSKIKKVKVKK